MSENARLIEEARTEVRAWGTTDSGGTRDWAVMLTRTADALEAAALTSDEDQMYVKRMEAERDAAFALAADSAESHVKAPGHCSGCDMALVIAADIRARRFFK